MKTPRVAGWFALASIALLALNLRTGVASLSPIVEFIKADIPIDTLIVGIIGTTTPLAFALSATISKRPSEKLGLERVLTATVIMIVVGHLLRSLASNSGVLVLGSGLALLGMGMGNVLIPVLVRKYFPNRVGIISSFYITITAISATASSTLAVPMAEQFGWRASLGQWALLGVLTLIPLLPLAIKRGGSSLELSSQPTTHRIWRSRTAWALAGMQSVTSIFGYVSFAWLPIMLTELKGVDALTAGVLLGLFAILGLPGSLVAPILAAKVRASQHALVWMCVAFGVVGPIGLVYSPNELLWVWIMFIGLAPSMFPLALTLYNLRSESRATVLAMSAFGQGISYSIASIGVITVGLLHELTGSWASGFFLMAGVAALGLLVGAQVMKHRTIDSELADAELAEKSRA